MSTKERARPWCIDYPGNFTGPGPQNTTRRRMARERKETYIAHMNKKRCEEGISSAIMFQTLLHRDTFTHRAFYTHNLLNTDPQMLLHTDPCTQKPIYTETRLHTETLTHRHFHTQTLLHKDPLTHKHIYTQTL